MKEQHGWSKTASGTTTATATKAAEAGRQHVIFGAHIGANFGTGTDMTITIKDGSTTIWETVTDGGANLYIDPVFPRGIPITRGNACSVTVTKAGATIRVNLNGVTRG